MKFRRVRVCNFTAFDEIQLEFCDGINVFLGENGTGKTHLLRLLYACAQMSDEKPDPDEALYNAFFPPAPRHAIQLSRLVRRGRGSAEARIKVERDGAVLTFRFLRGRVRKERRWEISGLKSWRANKIEAVFIPCKEMLVHAPGFMPLWDEGKLHFDEPTARIIRLALKRISRGPRRALRTLLPEIEKVLQIRRPQSLTHGVPTKGERFYLKSAQGEIEFELVAEGHRVFALLWLLVQNESLKEGTVLLWDEPEAHINPKLTGVLAKIIWALVLKGKIQVFLSTHNYFLIRELLFYQAEHPKETQGQIRFFGLYFEDKNKRRGLRCDVKDDFYELDDNPILDTFGDFYDRDIELFKAGYLKSLSRGSKK